MIFIHQHLLCWSRRLAREKLTVAARSSARVKARRADADYANVSDSSSSDTTMFVLVDDTRRDDDDMLLFRFRRMMGRRLTS